ncbi:MAG: peptide chain release factor-like protein [Betaproteobacteria bacterium]|nr:peptide chain release factor-like protein [Betaproteobacteria bacterium]
MLFQISSGRGPIECELAVGLYLEWLLRQNPQALVKEVRQGAPIEADRKRLTPYKSVLVEIPSGYLPVAGSVQWICPSPVRKGHRRKNWFIKVSAMRHDESIHGAYSNLDVYPAKCDKRVIRVESFRSPGKGGQNVNKVETGIRITHVPTGLVAMSVTARTQAANKKLALERLREKIAWHNDEQKRHMAATKWDTHNSLQRGNAVAVFRGLSFDPDAPINEEDACPDVSHEEVMEAYSHSKIN